MVIKKNEKFLLIDREEENYTEFSSEITKKYKEFSESNLVINLQSFDISEKDLLGFMELNTLHSEAKKSLVLVTGKVSIDEIPEELVVAPTLQEAEDIIQMDEIQRDLGF